MGWGWGCGVLSPSRLIGARGRGEEGLTGCGGVEGAAVRGQGGRMAAFAVVLHWWWPLD